MWLRMVKAAASSSAASKPRVTMTYRGTATTSHAANSAGPKVKRICCSKSKAMISLPELSGM